ncbi:RNA-guided endonuclease InsQ/TnpB family protein [Pseudonocardia asaccharolytica]|uniref:Transposase n=1 Tax=Pseudonocardia asaccharolytica DSM 44247 = NBRC 16224 TaxID=1123024 RepID=A0A511CVB5_9PSEU|nr:RNA-guided endonuclease TnpB family protein [Pseudonocardia asaccharolytica]GEL16491.1 hypothetical protein PA7_03280 [Pseudonocardia asaccharolytica DSM 44247 = NBRC 16224]
MRLRRYPTRAQEAGLLGHWAHARHVWNLAVEQLGHSRPGQHMPGYGEQLNRRKARQRLARLHARNADRRRDFVEKASTELAWRFDRIRIEDLRIKNMTRSARGTVERPGRNVAAKAALNRSILAGGWGLFLRRLQDKAPGRVEKINPAYTSQTCSACGHIARESRESQALFCCVACGHAEHADVNAAKNIAAGRAVRGAENSSASKREPQHAPPRVA